MPKGSPFTKKGTVKVTFHQAVPVSGLAKEDMPALMEHVRMQIQSGI
jgi:NAD(P)H-nitrite reductase large subunit